MVCFYGLNFLQRHVVTQDLSSDLKRFGWKRSTALSWYADDHMQQMALGKMDDAPDTALTYTIFPAPTAEELIEVFDRRFLVVHINDRGALVMCSGKHAESYRLVDALAKLWIKQNGGG